MSEIKTMIFSCFPACGKTWLYKHQDVYNLKILDSDSSEFSWIYSEHSIGRERNPDFPANYIKHIKENMGKYDYIFVSSHASVRDALDAENIEFTIVYPSKRCMAEWVGRCFVRDRKGESGCSADVLYDNWNRWIEECEIAGQYHSEIRLLPGQHLSDHL